MAKIKAGRLVPVENKDPHQCAASGYIACWVEDEYGENEECLLFTAAELKRIRERSAKNLEDWTEKSWLTDLLD